MEITLHYLSRHTLPAMLYCPFQLLPTIKLHATNTTKLWPWNVPPALYDQPIGGLRKEFNINDIVINPEEKLKPGQTGVLLLALAFPLVAAIAAILGILT